MGAVIVFGDFVVLDMSENPFTQLILGRDELKTFGALIDYNEEIITIRVAGEIIVFGFAKEPNEPMIEHIYGIRVLMGYNSCLFHYLNGHD